MKLLITIVMTEENFRIQIEDAQDSGLNKAKTEEPLKPGLPKSDISKNKNNDSFQANYSSKPTTDTAVDLASSSADNNKDVSSNSIKLSPDVEIYSEDPVNVYGITPAQAEYAEMVARLGDAYSNMFNLPGDDALISLANDLSKYHNDAGVDKAKMDALSKNIIYEGIKDTLSGLDANKYSSLYTNKSSYGRTSNGNKSSSIKNDVNNPYSSVAVDPYKNILDTIDGEINKIRFEIDYKNKKDIIDDPTSAIAAEAESNSSSDLEDNNYSNIDNVLDNVFDTKTSKWDLRDLPDAMSNMYDVYFRICDNNDDIDGNHLTPHISGTIDSLFSSKLLSARIQSIDIPAYERVTAQISSWGTSIERPTDKISTPGQSSFSIRGDTRLIYIDFMNILSGTTMADYLGIGSALFNESDNFSIAKTALFVKDLNGKIKGAQEEFEKKVEELKKEEKTALENVKLGITDTYFKSFVDSDKWNSIDNELASKAKKEGISLSQARYEFMEKDRVEQLIKLNEKLDDIENKKPGEGDSFWAFKKEQRQRRQELKESVKLIEKHNKEANAKIENTLKECASRIKAAERERDSAAVSVLLTTKADIPTIDAENVNAAAYVTGAIARNMAINFGGAPFKSLDELFNHKRIDIIVKRVSPGKTFKTTLTPKKDERFIFEDVKLLGTSDAIAFNRDSAETKSFTYQFIYKRFYKLDYYSDNAQDWVMSQLNALANTATDFALSKLKN